MPLPAQPIAGRGNKGGITGRITSDGEVVKIGGDDVLLTSRMIQFNDCDALLEHIRTEAAGQVGADVFEDNYVTKDNIDTADEASTDMTDFVVDNIDMVESDPANATNNPAISVPISADTSSEALRLADGLLSKLVVAPISADTSSESGSNVSGSSFAEGSSAGGISTEDSSAVSIPAGGSSESTSSSLRADVEYSKTNIQELDVDEADIIKTNGKHIFIIENNSVENDWLVVVDVASRTVAGSIKIADGQSAEMFLFDDSLLLIQRVRILRFGRPLGTDTDTSEGFTPSPTNIPGTVIQRIEVRDGEPEVVSTLRVEGEYFTSRSVNGIARVVLWSEPQWKFPFVFSKTDAAKAMAEKVNRRVVLESTLEEWLPAYDLDDSGWQTFSACENVHAPSQFSGFGVTTVLTLPVDGEMDPDTATTVLIPGDVLYASTTSLYTTSTGWTPISTQTEPISDAATEPDAEDSISDISELTTSIHRFDITDPDEVIYVSSGDVPGSLHNYIPGSLLSRFSLSEHDGYLRVVTTTRNPQTGDTETQLRVLRTEDKQLIEVGHIGNIGKDKKLQFVRFVGDIGFVVSSRQVNPFYTIDISDPTQPIIRGELKIRGSSSYLHPIDDNYLLGVGSDTDDSGRLAGTKVSLFDMSNLDNPRQVAAWTEPDTENPLNRNDRSFLWWAPKNLAVIPLRTQGSSAVVLKVSDGTITEVDRIENVHTGQGRLWRTSVIGTEIWTLNSTWIDDIMELESLLQVNHIDTLDHIDTVHLR